MKPRILLVNPPISDVAAFDLWARPLGLYLWAARLKQWGFRVAMIDCTDRRHPRLPQNNLKHRKDGRGHYYQEPMPERPEPVRSAMRRFKRYGLPPDALRTALSDAQESLDGRPDMVLMTTRMTYWYHAAGETARIVREELGRDIPLVVGGVYASLMPRHARAQMQPDFLLEGPALETLPELLEEKFGQAGLHGRGVSPEIAGWPSPAYELMHDRTALPILTSVGCPGQCSYCAARTLWDRGFHRMEAAAASEHIAHLRERFGTRHFAFYDDALLALPEKWFDPFLNALLEMNLDVRFHLPNGIHYAPLSNERAERMREAGFHTIRLSLESTRPERLQSYRREGSNEDFRQAVSALRSVGYEQSQVGAYILAGTPGQKVEEVREAIDFVYDCGAHVRLCEYSPIPGTRDWREALEASGGELAGEPLWQNNNLYYHRPEAPIGPDAFEEMKERVKRGRVRGNR
ncbi:MAG: B12-binding domain-containing radical SAM protein [Candidatus Sumerlaeota bacterium]